MTIVLNDTMMKFQGWGFEREIEIAIATGMKRPEVRAFYGRSAVEVWGDIMEEQENPFLNR